ncbi:MAG: energy transducer TonB [Cyclobacteriaceae bacterium]
MKEILIITTLFAILSCEQKQEEFNATLIKSKYLEENPGQDDYFLFTDSLCNSAIELAKSRALNNVYRLYQIDNSMDSSSTPTQILMDDLNFKVLGEFEKKYSYRYCYNKATYYYFEQQNGFSAFEYIVNKYDSLFELGLTDEPPQFLEGDPLETLNSYFYCNMELANVELDSVMIYFKIDKAGRPTDLQLVQSSGHELDSVTYNLIKDMPTWKPARGNNGEPRSGWDYTFRFYYNEELKEEYCI